MMALEGFPFQRQVFDGERLQGELLAHGVGRLLLTRPTLRNAFDGLMVEELTHCLEAFAALDALALRVLVLAGEGPVFCAGADLGYMRAQAESGVERNLADARALAGMFHRLASFPAPVVCAVQGAALGGGLGLALCSDAVIADADAQFGTTEVRLGIVPGVISPYVLRKVGLAHGGALMLTGRRFGAEEACTLGLVHQRVAPGESLETCLAATLGEYLQAGPQAARATKALLLRAHPLPDAEWTEFTVQAIAQARSSGEGQAGLSAFLEKGTAPWLAGLPGGRRS